MMKYYITTKKILCGKFTVIWEIEFGRKVKPRLHNQLKISAAAGGEGSLYAMILRTRNSD